LGGCRVCAPHALHAGRVTRSEVPPHTLPRVSWVKGHRTLVIAAAAIIVVFLAGLLLGDRLGRSDSSNSTTTTNATTTTAADPAVVDLQRVMTRLGYYTGPIDGVYGPATTAAVTAMQKALGVTADGVYGPATAVALKGKGQEVVVEIQIELTTYGYYSGPIDGDYGAATKAAVKQLQTDLGVTPDGLVGSETVAAFDKAVADGTLTPVTTTTTATATTATTTTAPTTTATSTATATTT
jgi:peptidoglycan hydrolase-like protein with peptidoglycan-binding domain